MITDEPKSYLMRMQSPETWGTLPEEELRWAGQFGQTLSWDEYQSKRPLFKPMTSPLTKAEPATDEQIVALEKLISIRGGDASWPRANLVMLSLISRIHSEREKAIRECATELQTMAADVRNGASVRLSFSIAASRVLALSSSPAQGDKNP